MPISIGSVLGSHDITALLGKGGMGEVYRARDLRLKREVAIKILPEEFSRDADRIARFQREAEVLASLNYPNIAAIHSLEEVEGTRFLVMELVEVRLSLSASRAVRYRSMKRCTSGKVFATHWKRRMRKESFIGI